MAPKKKKRPAANPARGFATTSVPSKSKIVEQVDKGDVDTHEESQAEGGDTKVTAGTTDNAAPHDSEHSKQGAKISGMSPEELEAHLEDAELEAMVEKYATRCLANARRQAAKLETERRQLRLQAHKLSTYSWLPDETIDELFDMISGFQTAAHSALRGCLPPTDVLAVDLWTLERVLLSLKFPRVSSAIAHIAELALMGQVTPVTDSLPGMSEALQWYASNALPDELMNYEQTIGTETIQSGDSTPVRAVSGESNCASNLYQCSCFMRRSKSRRE